MAMTRSHNDTVPHLHIHLCAGPVAAKPQDARGIDQIIQTAVPLGPAADAGRHERLVREVALQMQVAAASGCDIRRRGFHVGGGHVGAAGQQSLRDREPHSPASAGHESHFA
jgi:hypothetical protein